MIYDARWIARAFMSTWMPTPIGIIVLTIPIRLIVTLPVGESDYADHALRWVKMARERLQAGKLTRDPSKAR